MTNMISADLITSLDHAAAMNDRCLFIASVVVVGIFGAWLMRCFVGQHERLLGDHKQARECCQESLRGVVAEQSAANAKLIVCLVINTKVRDKCRDQLRLVQLERKEI